METRVQEILQQVQALYAIPTNHTRFHLSRGANNEYVSPRSPSAVCWCVQGAVLKEMTEEEYLNAMNDLKDPLFHEIEARLSKGNRLGCHYTGFNDTQPLSETMVMISNAILNKNGKTN